MTKQTHRLLRYITAVLFGSIAGQTWAETDSTVVETPLPSWQVLEYEQKAFFVTAKSRIEIAPREKVRNSWRLSSQSSVASNSEEMHLDLNPEDGSAQYRTRQSKGKQQRYKSYDFLPDYIERVRREADGNTQLPPCEWPVSGRQEVTYPEEASGLAITDAYALLVIAGRLLESGNDSAELVINTEFNFYRVVLNLSAQQQSVKANYQLQGSESTVSGKRIAREVTLAISPIGDQPDKPDFSLLGLNSNISILLDEENGLPLQLRGNAPRIGSTQIDLKGATLRQAPP